MLLVFLDLFLKLLARFAHSTLGISKAKYSSHCFTITMLLVLKSFIKKWFTANS